MHLGMSYQDIYRLPVRYRAWYIERLTKFFENKYKPKEKEASQPINNKNNFEAYENMLQNKFKNN